MRLKTTTNPGRNKVVIECQQTTVGTIIEVSWKEAFPLHEPRANEGSLHLEAFTDTEVGECFLEDATR